MSARVSGSKVLLTGATGGLGQAIARELASRGARLVLTGRQHDVLEPLAGELGAEAQVVDLADRAAVAALADASSDVDVLVANAAHPGSGRLDAYSVEELDEVLDVNLRAPIVLAHALSPRMVERGRGSLVFVSSLAGKAGTPRSSLYNATKFGLRGFALGLRSDLERTGVGVSVVSPGFISEAGMFHKSGARLPPGVGTKTPADVSRAVVRAIERSPAEIAVAPLPLRAGAAFAGLAPGVAAAVGGRLGARRISDAISSGQAAHR